MPEDFIEEMRNEIERMTANAIKCCRRGHTGKAASFLDIACYDALELIATGAVQDATELARIVTEAYNEIYPEEEE